MGNYKFSFNPITGNFDLVNKESTINYDRISDTYSNTEYDTLNVEQVENDVTITLSRVILDQAFFSLFLNGLRLLDNIDFMYDNQANNKVHILNYQLNSNTDTIICKYRSEKIIEKDYIPFADPIVGQICADNWGDGIGITYAQAAEVTDLGTIFRENTEITSFDELQFFTRLTYLKNSVFLDCANLNSIIMPQSIQLTSSAIFRRCSSLSSVVLSESLQAIEAYVFENCNDLEFISLPNSILNINGNAFAECWSLKSIDIPNSVISIYIKAFYNCNNMTSITIRALIPPTLSPDAFLLTTSLTNIYVPLESVEAYKTDPNWSVYESIISEIRII